MLSVFTERDERVEEWHGMRQRRELGIKGEGVRLMLGTMARLSWRSLQLSDDVSTIIEIRKETREANGLNADTANKLIRVGEKSDNLSA